MYINVKMGEPYCCLLLTLLPADMNRFIPGGVLDPASWEHELQAPEARYRLARAVLQEIPRQVGG